MFSAATALYCFSFKGVITDKSTVMIFLLPFHIVMCFPSGVAYFNSTTSVTLGEVAFLSAIRLTASTAGVLFTTCH